MEVSETAVVPATRRGAAFTDDNYCGLLFLLLLRVLTQVIVSAAMNFLPVSFHSLQRLGKRLQAWGFGAFGFWDSRFTQSSPLHRFFPGE